METRRQTARIVLLGGLGAGLAALPALAQQAPTAEQLTRMLEQQQRQIETLRQDVEKLRQAQSQQPTGPPAAAPAPGQTPAPGTPLVITTGDVPGSFKIPGTDLSLRISGLAKGDYVQSFGDVSNLAEDFFPVAGIPTRASSDRSGDRVIIHGRQSRLAFEAFHPTPYGRAHAHIEADFFGEDIASENLSNGYEFRMRHAYVELGPALIGQFWGTFTDPSAYAETLDFSGPNGQSFIRQGQIRWTQPLGDGLSVAVAVENPEGQVLAGSANFAPNAPAERIPDGVVRLRYERPWGHLQSGVVLRELTTQLNGAPSTVREETTFGYGVNLSGRISTPWLHPKDNFRFQGQYGEGIGRYIQDLGFAGLDSFVTSTGELERIEAFGGYGAFQHWWTDAIRSSVVGSYVEISNPSSAPASQYNNGAYLSGNLIWSPIPRVDVGVELQFGRREDQDGQSGELVRVQTSASYRF